jgi:hypothetical protein
MLGVTGQSRDVQSQRPPPEREDEAPVRVVVRSRPLNAIEKSDGCRYVFFLVTHTVNDSCTVRSCLQFPGGNAILLGKDKAFTYDSVYGELAGQSSIFDDWVVALVDGCFQGKTCFLVLPLCWFIFLSIQVTTPRYLRTGRRAAARRTQWAAVALKMS